MGVRMGVWEGAVRGGDRDRSGVDDGPMATSKQKCVWGRPSYNGKVG